MLRVVLLIGVAVFAGGACASKPWIDPGSGWKTVTSKHFVIHTEKTFDEIDAAAHVHARRMLTTRSEAVIVLPAVPPSPPTINSRPAEPTRVRNLCAEIRQVMLDEDKN